MLGVTSVSFLSSEDQRWGHRTSQTTTKWCINIHLCLALLQASLRHIRCCNV